MGSSADCSLGEFFIRSTKSDVVPSLMLLFRASDRRTASSFSEALPHSIQYWFRENSEETTSVVYYSAPISVIRDRLEVLGYTQGTARQAFAEYVRVEREHLAEYLASPEHGGSDLLGQEYRWADAILSKLTVDAWVSEMQRLRETGVARNHFPSIHLHSKNGDSLSDYMLSHGWYGIPEGDEYLYIRLALAARGESHFQTACQMGF